MKPFDAAAAKTIGAIGEQALIARMRGWLGDASPPAPFGIGDDCAVVEVEGKQVVTTDPIIYRRHFDDSISPEQAARKLVRRNLSDLAAMGAMPAYATLSLALADNVSIAWIERFYKALGEEARHFHFSIVGGDVSGADSFLGVFMTLVGCIAKDQRVLLRHQASPGALIYVSGALGGTRLGKHVDFQPRLDEGRWLATGEDCIACTDISDGIGKDLINLLSPDTAAEIDCSKVPLAEAAKAASSKSGQSALYHAFNDGEDFELLFAIDPQTDPADFEQRWASRFSTPLTCIGTSVARPSDTPLIMLLGAPDDLDAHGYEHLR